VVGVYLVHFYIDMTTLLTRLCTVLFAGTVYAQAFANQLAYRPCGADFSREAP
jgi:hypothetical protein